MRRLALLGVLALVSCGGHTVSPEAVVRAWSDAIDRGDDDAAAALFARGARVIQGDVEIRLADRDEARAWNGGLPCSGRIVSLRTRGELVTAIFELDDRPGHTCDGPGARAEAVVRVHAGKIVLWHELGTVAPAPPIA